MYCQTRDIENELFFFFPINHFGGVKYTNSITFNLIYIYNRYIYIYIYYIYIYLLYIYISIIYISIIYIHIHICIMYNLYITPTLVVSSHISGNQSDDLSVRLVPTNRGISAGRECHEGADVLGMSCGVFSTIAGWFFFNGKTIGKP